jgi:serine/threonine protein kinase
LLGGKYCLEAPLGEGGMGTVWFARNVTLDAPVALKLIRPEMRAAETTERLLREARVEAKLKHPNIVRVFDFGQTEVGDAFIVMELLEGQSLDELLEQRRQLSPAEAVELLLPVVGALRYAHKHGVVHRDIKPQNIFLDRAASQSGPKLLDFGIAKLKGEPERQQTESGKLLGSPGYMAPEQAYGAPDVDERADIWAVCVVLYEAVSGGPAFDGEGYALLRKVVEDELPPLSSAAAGASELWAILARGLQKHRHHRFQSMLELEQALRLWSEGRSYPADAVDPRERSDRAGDAPSWQATTRRLDQLAGGASGEDSYARPSFGSADAGWQLSDNTRRSGRFGRLTRIALAGVIALGVLSVMTTQENPERSTSGRGIAAAQRPVSPQRPQKAPPVAAVVDSAPLTAPVRAEALGVDVHAVTPPGARASRRQQPAHRRSEAELGLKVPYQ